MNDVGLTEKENELTKTLSGGQKRKLSVGIALIGGSQVVFLGTCALIASLSVSPRRSSCGWYMSDVDYVNHARHDTPQFVLHR